MSDIAVNEPDGAVSEKGARTRTQILEAASRLFAERGYEGTGIRDIEHAAGVNRGVVTYHFGNKEEVWKATFSHTFSPFLDDLRSKADLLRALDHDSRVRFLIANFVRTSAKRPFMNQLMIQENFSASWRSDWIIEHFLRPARELNLKIGSDDPWMQLLERDPHVRYALLGACNLAFSLPCEVSALYGEDVAAESFIERHISTILDIYTGFFARVATQKDKGNV